MALYDRFQRLEDIGDLPPRQLRLLRDIRKHLRFVIASVSFLTLANIPSWEMS